jgi:tetratricopeptide (TPR) repeat protein
MAGCHVRGGGKVLDEPPGKAAAVGLERAGPVGWLARGSPVRCGPVSRASERLIRRMRFIAMSFDGWVRGRSDGVVLAVAGGPGPVSKVACPLCGLGCCLGPAVPQRPAAFAGSFGLAELARVCGDSDEAASLEVIDRLAGKSLVAPERSELGTRYRLLETVRQYAADRLAEADATAAVKRRHALAYLGLAGRERRLEVLSRDQDNFRATLEWSLNSEDETGPRLAHALGEFWLARGLLHEARDWLERALAQTVPDQRMRAGLLRLLGAVLYDVGDLDRAEATLSQGAEVAAAAGAVAAGARIRILLADVHGMQGTGFQAALAECQTATAVLESENDLEGLAEAWLLAGQLRIWLAQPPADQDALEQALAYARQSGSHRTQILAACWLVASLSWLPIPGDVAISRAEQLLQAASDPWAQALIRMPFLLLYGYAGRYADARAASAQSRSTLARAGARYQWALCAVITGQMELATGNPAAAEPQLKQVHEALRDMKDRGWVGFAAALMADALYAQGHLGEAQQMTEEAEEVAVPDDHVPQAWWRTVRAKLLARRGDFSAARLLLGQAEALIPPIWGALIHVGAAREPPSTIGVFPP